MPSLSFLIFDRTPGHTFAEESEGENGSQFQSYRVLGTHNIRSISTLESVCVILDNADKYQVSTPGPLIQMAVVPLHPADSVTHTSTPLPTVFVPICIPAHTDSVH